MLLKRCWVRIVRLWPLGSVGLAERQAGAVAWTGEVGVVTTTSDGRYIDKRKHKTTPSDNKYTQCTSTYNY